MLPPVPDPGPGPVKLAGHIGLLKKAWESSARVTKDDWQEWLRHFAVELLAQSPSPALRACHGLAQVRLCARWVHCVLRRARLRCGAHAAHVGVARCALLRACC